KWQQTTGLTGKDAEVRRIADELWATCGRSFGKGRLVCTGTGRELLLSDHVAPDFEVEKAAAGTIDYIHRSDNGTEIYFVSNQGEQPVHLAATFRVTGKTVELWDGVSGKIWAASSEPTGDGRTQVQLDLVPYGSTYVVFRADGSKAP